jgi:hypothetical protein
LMDTSTDMMAAPVRQVENGKTVPRRAGTRTMVPLSWLDRTVKIEYVGAGGMGQETSATLIDWTPVGLLVSISGAKCLMPWERLVLLELVAD